jgi:hypothetical protein
MVDYQYEQLFPFSRDRVWKLLQDHLDDSLIMRVHPLVKHQRTISKGGDTTVVDRTIEARGKLLTSQWRVTTRPPDSFRWEVLTSNGPYAAGSWMENTYTQEGANTRIQSQGSLTISVLPFFLPQRTFIRRVLDSIDAEDQSYLRS